MLFTKVVQIDVLVGIEREKAVFQFQLNEYICEVTGTEATVDEGYNE